jgi:hypothetical protein
MRFRVTANNTNGNLPRHEEWFDTEERAKRHGDWWHGQSSLCNVEVDEPLGVLLTFSNGSTQFEVAPDMPTAIAVRDSWQGVVNNRKINRSTVRKVEICGVRQKTAVATAEDQLVGAWMAAALDDHMVCPSMKYDINRWIDSKEWV